MNLTDSVFQSIESAKQQISDAVEGEVERRLEIMKKGVGKPTLITIPISGKRILWSEAEIHFGLTASDVALSGDGSPLEGTDELKDGDTVYVTKKLENA